MNFDKCFLLSNHWCVRPGSGTTPLVEHYDDMQQFINMTIPHSDWVRSGDTPLNSLPQLQSTLSALHLPHSLALVLHCLLSSRWWHGAAGRRLHSLGGERSTKAGTGKGERKAGQRGGVVGTTMENMVLPLIQSGRHCHLNRTDSFLVVSAVRKFLTHGWTSSIP